MGPTKQRLLCVDNHASRNLAVFLLEQANYEVIMASSIADGIRLAKSRHFDLYLINHQLLHGAERKLYDHWSKLTPHIPVLFYSTVTYPYHQRRAGRRGIYPTPARPIEISEVVNAVSRLLNPQVKPAEAADTKRHGRGLTALFKMLAAIGIGAAAMVTLATMQGRNSGLSGET